MRRTKTAIVCLAALLAFQSGVARAQGPVTVPASVQLPILAKVWTLDRTFTGKAPVTILVLYQGRFRESFTTKEEFVAAARGAAGITVRIIDIESSPLRPQALANVDVAYFTPLRSVTLADLLVLTRAARVRTVTAVPDYVARGVAVGITLQQNRPSLIINLPASRAEGSDLSSQLLKLARVIR